MFNYAWLILLCIFFQVPYLKATIPIAKGTHENFAVVVRPVVHKHSVSSGGETIVSDVDRRIRVEIPRGTFYEETNLQMQVTVLFYTYLRGD